jgi:hypothetical protein
VPDFCTCGAELPANARFCHICGRPLREEDIAKPAAAVVITPTIAPPPSAALNFRNGAALRAGLLSAFVSLLLGVLVPLPAVAPMGGFFSVYLYRRRTGQSVSVRSGARIGWIMGLILFGILAVMLVLLLALVSSYPGGSNGLMAEMRNSHVPVQKEMMDQLAQYLQNPAKIVTPMVGVFLMISLATIMGGALAGKLVGKAGSGPAHLPQ